MMKTLYTEAILPMMRVSNTAALMIGTPGVEENYFRMMLDVIDPQTGEPVFYIVRKRLCCDSCKGRYSICCPCNMSLRPTWVSGRQESALKLLYELDEATGEQELSGAQQFDSFHVFEPSVLEEANRQPLVDVHSELEKDHMTLIAGNRLHNDPMLRALANAEMFSSFVVTSVDPNGGGNSKAAIVSYLVSAFEDDFTNLSYTVRRCIGARRQGQRARCRPRSTSTSG